LRAALAERKAEEAEVAERRQLEADRRAAEAEAKRKASLKKLSDAEKAAKQEKKAKKHAQSAFAVQEAQERQAAAERLSQDQRASELASEYEAAERQQQALRAADGAHAERRESRSTAGGSSDLSATDLAAMDGLSLAERSAERPELTPELTPSAIIDRVVEICACTREQASQAVARVGPLRWAWAKSRGGGRDLPLEHGPSCEQRTGGANGPTRGDEQRTGGADGPTRTDALVGRAACTNRDGRHSGRSGI